MNATATQPAVTDDIAAIESITDPRARIAAVRALEARLAAELATMEAAEQEKLRKERDAKRGANLDALNALLTELEVKNPAYILAIAQGKVYRPNASSATPTRAPVKARASVSRPQFRRQRVGTKARRLNDTEVNAILAALRVTNPNVSKVARDHKVTRQTVYTHAHRAKIKLPGRWGGHHHHRKAA